MRPRKLYIEVQDCNMTDLLHQPTTKRHIFVTIMSTEHVTTDSRNGVSADYETTTERHIVSEASRQVDDCCRQKYPNVI
jgi:hypothetical protein